MRFAALLLLAALPASAQHPRDSEIKDPDTLAWWHTTESLSNDSMEGRDTGTAAYQRAANMVADRFKAAGLKPAGDKDTYQQQIPLHEVSVESTGTTFEVLGPRPGGRITYQFLQDITINPADNLPGQIDGALTFRGYCGKDAMDDVLGKVVVCFGTQRLGLPTSGERVTNARNGGALGLINVDDPFFSIEPPRWPYAYARTVVARTTEAKAAVLPFPVMRLSELAFVRLLSGSKENAIEILKAGGAKQPLASFEIAGRFHANLTFAHRDYSSPNVLAILPGSDAKLADQVEVIAAHLDGYGFGSPVNGDKLYNGTLDDAAYVALLIQMADDIKSGKLPKPKRSILFCAFTGEEKGLLGSNWFIAHPTLAKERMIADVNLDQLRPLFPLNILTAEALTDSTLGQTATEVGKAMNIELRPDNEPERGLLRRADQFPFLKAGIPAISFIFGYDPDSEAEKRYREWYQVRYHRPQDDTTQPMDFDAATKFNDFFYKLVESIANAPVKPSFSPNSPFATN